MFVPVIRILTVKVILEILTWYGKLPLFVQVKFMVATYGPGTNIRATVREIMRASMTDALMVQYNKTGTRGSRRFPPGLLNAIYGQNLFLFPKFNSYSIIICLIF